MSFLVKKTTLENCAICLESINKKEDMMKLHAQKKISHVFHRACIDEWFKAHDTCPICRETNVAPKKVKNEIELTVQGLALFEAERFHATLHDARRDALSADRAMLAASIRYDNTELLSTLLTHIAIQDMDLGSKACCTIC